MKLVSSFALCLTTSALVAQGVPCFDSNLGTPMVLTDDSFTTPMPLGFTFNFAGVAYTDIQICSNGFIVMGLGAPGTADYSPTSAELLANLEPRICPLWCDMNPASAGTVYHNVVPAAGSTPAYCTVTFVDCVQWGTTTPLTFQLTFIDGDGMQIYYAGNISGLTAPWLIGCSPGNGATANPVDFTMLPIVTSGVSTLHQEGVGSFPIADSHTSWVADGLGGYVVTPVSGCARKESYGVGCVAQYSSYYEYFDATPNFDLSNTSMTGIFTGTSYVITAGTSTWVAPSLSATALTLADDSFATVTLSTPFAYPGGTTPSLDVCSNGFISPMSNSTSYQPLPATMLAWPNPTWAVWRDLMPNAGGTVWFEEVGGVAIITYDQVLSYVGTAAGVTPSTFQFQFDLATGFFHVIFQSMDTVSISGWSGGEGYVVGWSPGNGAGDPGNTDLTDVVNGLTTLTPFASDTFPVGLEADAAPVVGTSVNMTMSNITATAPFAGILYGLTRFDPGLDLTGIGMAGCYQYNDSVSVQLVFPAGASSVTSPFAIPNFPGVAIQVQGAVFDPAAGLTALGAMSSNGVELEIGN